MKTICINYYEIENSLQDYIREFQGFNYKYVVKAQDNCLSGWGYARNKKHIQLILCSDYEELTKIVQDLRNDKTMSYVNWWFISDIKGITQATRGKTWTLRNDWTRAFYSQKEKDKYMRIEG